MVSPDPAGLSAVNTTNPQTWNSYAYVSNSPLDAVDPLGLCGLSDIANAAVRNLSLTPGALELCSIKEIFREHFFDLPGHGNPPKCLMDVNHPEKICRMRFNFREFATFEELQISDNVDYFTRLSCAVNTSGVASFVNDVSGDNQIGLGNTPITWNLQ